MLRTRRTGRDQVLFTLIRNLQYQRAAYLVRVCIAFTITSQTWSVLAEASAPLPGGWHLPTSIRARAPFLGRTSHEN